LGVGVFYIKATTKRQQLRLLSTGTSRTEIDEIFSFVSIIARKTRNKVCKMSGENVYALNVHTPNKWETDVTYVSFDDTNIVCFTTISCDTRAAFFPENYAICDISAAFVAYAEFPAIPFQHEFREAEKLFNFESYNDQETHATTVSRPKTYQRKKLDEHEVRQISGFHKNKVAKTASKLAAEYGVTAKAIRDIWTGRTWRDMA